MRSIGIVVVLLALSPRAGAQSRSKEGKVADEVKRDYVAATKCFNLADYDCAIAGFDAAYRLKDDPAFLYDIAQSHRLAGHLEQAIRFYRNYLRAVPYSQQRG